MLSEDPTKIHGNGVTVGCDHSTCAILSMETMNKHTFMKCGRGDLQLGYFRSAKHVVSVTGWH